MRAFLTLEWLYNAWKWGCIRTALFFYISFGWRPIILAYASFGIYLLSGLILWQYTPWYYAQALFLGLLFLISFHFYLYVVTPHDEPGDGDTTVVRFEEDRGLIRICNKLIIAVCVIQMMVFCYGIGFWDLRSLDAYSYVISGGLNPASYLLLAGMLQMSLGGGTKGKVWNYLKGLFRRDDWNPATQVRKTLVRSSKD